ncbi:MAG: hypothetical protein FGM25_01450 [Mycobacterium sp.]|nr:hypothetical protein [Mycobacterium sp.]
MATTPATHVDVAGLRSAAQRMEVAADILSGALLPPACSLGFDATVAGRSHADAGAMLRGAVDRLVAGVAAAAASSRDVAHTLRACAEGYGNAETYAAETLR